ncbi:HIRAN domain-containing protein [Rosistilla oblonga]|uniref:HIRAN domain protein n=1 Tax=Rosistilla oblonga TaxID=2527990 RepID=A0A518IUK5_9BACT|nr:HIRAN domain-containing protein [Rosistilla oblonga]QDV56771.1 HIRAN domain protein [Rosistilla oblonga]
MASKTLRRHLDGPELFQLEVVGESHFQKNLQAILSRYESHRIPDRVTQRATARIVSEPTNKHDPNAVQVLIEDLLIGYLDRETAARIRKQLAHAGFDSIDATCSSLIVGGFNLQFGHVLYGVKLDIFTKSQRRRKAQDVPVTELTFFTETPAALAPNELLAYVGNAVKFWSSPDTPSRIHIYCRGGVGGDGKLGTVPKDYIIPIQRHLSAGLEFDATIIAQSDQRWQIRCRLIQGYSVFEFVGLAA